MAIKNFRLPNGITCVVDERPQSGKVSMQVHLNSAFDADPSENGLTALAAKTCLLGTTTKSYDQITNYIESRGAKIDALAGPKLTVFKGSALARDAGDIFSVLSDVIRRPSLGSQEVGRTKERMKAELDDQKEEPALEADKNFFEAAFPGQTTGLDPMGTPERLDSYTQQQVRKKQADFLAHPENMIISFAGDITAADAQKLVENNFSDLSATATAVTKPQEKFVGGDVRKSTSNEQLNLEFGFEAPRRDDPDRYTAVLLNEILTGMSGPLFQEIREKRSLVYTVQPRYVPLDTSGVFSIMAGAGKGKAGELISVAINDVFGKIIRDGVSQEAIDQARERIIRSIEAQNETKSSACSGNASQMTSYGRVRSIEETKEYYKQVTSDDIRRVCANMLRDGKYALSTVGPQDTLPTSQEIKDMMQAQLKGVDVPVARPVKPSIKAQFNQAAKKEEFVVQSKMTLLPNGIKVLTTERPGTLSCGAWVGSGSDGETPVQNGAAHVLEHMMFKGTSTYDEPGQIDRIVEGQLGGRLNAFTTKDKTAYFFYNLDAKALEPTVDICGEMVFDATLDHDEFDGKTIVNPDGSTKKTGGEREVIIEELNRSNDNVHTPLTDLLFKTAYPDQAHGRPTIGTEKTLRAMTVDDFTTFRDDHYVPDNVVFAAAGPIKHEDFVALVEKKFGQVPTKEAKPTPLPVYKGGTNYIEEDKADLCDVMIAAESVPSTNADSIAYRALGMILAGGNSARLYEQGVFPAVKMMRSIESGDMALSNSGIFYVAGSMMPQAVGSFITSVYQEIYALTGDLTQGELDKVKANMEMSLLSSMETNQDACNQYAINALANGKLVKQDELSAQIQKLTVDDVKRVARKVMASNPTLAMVVPPKTDPRFLPRQEDMTGLHNQLLGILKNPPPQRPGGSGGPGM